MKNVVMACVIMLLASLPIAAAQDSIPAPIPAEHGVPLQANDRLSLTPNGAGERSMPFFDTPADSAQSDSLRHAMALRLLPQHLSFVERGLWGESGILRTTGVAGPLTPESRKNELSVRRGMLTVHQVGGLVTLALMGTAVYFGQMTMDNPESRSYRQSHSTFVTSTIISYSLTGALSILSPPPLLRRDEVSTTSIHKTLAWVHATGMILTPILGASLKRSMSYSQSARFHQISAYITTATFAAAMIVITF